MVSMSGKAAIVGLAGALALAGCTEREVILTGERMNVRDVLETRADPLDGKTVNGARAVALGGQVSNSDWPQSGVSPFARVGNAAYSGGFAPLWAVPVGAGDSRRNRLNVDPVAAGGRIFTVSADHQVQATSTGGEVLWTYDLTPQRDDAKQGQGGGLAFDDGRLIVASGFGTVTALDAASGAELWVQRLGATGTGKPSARGGVVYVVAGDQTAFAIEADSGRVRWQIEGIADVNNVAGGPAPAISDKYVVFSFGTATLQSAFRQGGLRLWNADILGRRNGVAVAGIDDMTGDPVIAGDTIYAGNHSGRFVAFSLADGERLWTARQGALGPAWPAGDSVFFVTDRNQLVRLDAGTGEQIWAVDLPGYEPTRKPNRRREASFANHGPILAGGRLIVAATDGQLRSFDPADGSLVGSTEIAGGATTRPIVAGGTLYVVSGKGVLHAYR